MTAMCSDLHTALSGKSCTSLRNLSLSHCNKSGSGNLCCRRENLPKSGDFL